MSDLQRPVPGASASGYGLPQMPQVRGDPALATQHERRPSVAHPIPVVFDDDVRSSSEDMEDSVADSAELTVSEQSEPQVQQGSADPTKLTGTASDFTRLPGLQQNALSQLGSGAPLNPYAPPPSLGGPRNSRHRKAQTMAPMVASTISPTSLGISGFRTNHHRRNKSQSSMAQMTQYPEGPDLTFMCTILEGKAVLSNPTRLGQGQYQHLMTMYKGVVEQNVESCHGYIISNLSSAGSSGDFLVVFDDVYSAATCAINIQKSLHMADWPAFLNALMQSGALRYNGNPAEAFNGLRVGVSLHTGRVGEAKNPFDGRSETLEVKQRPILLSREYVGQAVDLCKAMIRLVCGGEILCTEATSRALNLTRKMGDEIYYTKLGEHKFGPLTSTRLVRLVPTDAAPLSKRHFPDKVLNSGVLPASSTEHLDRRERSDNYDPFPNDEPSPRQQDIASQEATDEAAEHSSEEDVRDYSKHYTDPSSMNHDVVRQLWNTEPMIKKPPAPSRSKTQQILRGPFRRDASPAFASVDEGAVLDKPRQPKNKKPRRGSFAQTPQSPSSSTGLSGSRGGVTHPNRVMRYFDERPSDLPKDYGEDDEFQCSVCDELRRWDKGVWRCHMWPCFDVCSHCAETQLSNLERNDYRKGGAHRGGNSTVPMLRDIQETENFDAPTRKLTGKQLVTRVRTELGEVIEALMRAKFRHLQHIQASYHEGIHDKGKLAEAKDEEVTAEKELSEWRQLRALHDKQEQILARRRSHMATGTMDPVAAVEEDEILASHEEYDPIKDFRTIHEAFVDNQRLHGLEQQFALDRFKNHKIERRKTLQALEIEMSNLQQLYEPEEHGTGDFEIDFAPSDEEPSNKPSNVEMRILEREVQEAQTKYRDLKLNTEKELELLQSQILRKDSVIKEKEIKVRQLTEIVNKLARNQMDREHADLVAPMVPSSGEKLSRSPQGDDDSDEEPEPREVPRESLLSRGGPLIDPNEALELMSTGSTSSPPSVLSPSSADVNVRDLFDDPDRFYKAVDKTVKKTPNAPAKMFNSAAPRIRTVDDSTRIFVVPPHAPSPKGGMPSEQSETQPLPASSSDLTIDRIAPTNSNYDIPDGASLHVALREVKEKSGAVSPDESDDDSPLQRVDDYHHPASRRGSIQLPQIPDYTDDQSSASLHQVQKQLPGQRKGMHESSISPLDGAIPRSREPPTDQSELEVEDEEEVGGGAGVDARSGGMPPRGSVEEAGGRGQKSDAFVEVSPRPADAPVRQVARDHEDFKHDTRPVDVKDEMLEKLHRAETRLVAQLEDARRSKMRLIETTSKQMEEMRDQIGALKEALEISFREKEELKARYEEENKQEEGRRASKDSGWSLTSFFPRGVSTPLWKHKVQDTEKSKMALANQTSAEIERLRQIILTLSRQLDTPGTEGRAHRNYVPVRQASTLPDDPPPRVYPPPQAYVSVQSGASLPPEVIYQPSASSVGSGGGGRLLHFDQRRPSIEELGTSAAALNRHQTTIVHDEY